MHRSISLRPYEAADARDMVKTPWDGLEAKVQKFCDGRRDSIKFAIRASAINLDDPMLDHLGRKLLEDGIRGLVPIIDTPQSVAAGSEALKKIIKGIAFLSVSAAYSEITKNAIVHEHASAAGKKSGENRRTEAEEFWRSLALKCAVAIRKEDKTITQVNLANQIKLRWKSKTIKCRESQLIGLISRWEREGKLARRNK